MFSRIAAFASVLGICSLGGASAQSKIILYSPLTKTGQPVPQICREAEVVFRATLIKYPHPEKWTYVIACDSQSWDSLEQHVGIVANRSYVLGMTDFDRGFEVTYLKGSVFAKFPAVGNNQADHVLSHELAHIALRSKDEGKVDDLAQTWMAAARLVASKSVVAVPAL